MPLENGEVLSRAAQQIRKAAQDMQSSARELGTARDAIARDRLRRARLLVKQSMAKADPLLANADPSLDSICSQYRSARTDFEEADNEATRREKQTFRQTEYAPNTASSSSREAATEQVRVQDIRPVDLSEFHTEENIQREKLRNVRELESDVTDLKTTYQEFHSLVNQQQDGVDAMTGHVGESHTLIERGHVQLQGASKKQKRFRKVGCIVGIILVVIIVIVIIVVIAVT